MYADSHGAASDLALLQSEIEALPAGHGEFLPAVGDVTRIETWTAVEQSDGACFESAIIGRSPMRWSFGRPPMREWAIHALVEADWGDLQTVLRTNIDGVLHSVRACVPAMRRNRGGRILIVSSVVAGVHTPYTAVYAASKAFVSSLAGSLRLELEGDKISVTDVLVGRTISEFNQHRLGSSHRNRGGLPTMSAEQVAAALVAAAARGPRHVILQLFDRLILGEVESCAPGVMGRMALRQYGSPDDE